MADLEALPAKKIKSAAAARSLPKNRCEYQSAEDEEDRPMIRDWGVGVPSELLHCIVERLDALSDLASFSYTCRGWRSIGRDWSRRRLHHHFRSPLVMLPNVKVLGGSPYSPGLLCQRFLDISHNRALRLLLPTELRTEWCVGAAPGWLMLLNRNDSAGGFGVHLLNPLTNACVRLPPLTNLETDHRCSVMKAMLFHGDRSSLETEGECSGLGPSPLAVAIDIRRNSLFFCRPGDTRWVLVTLSDTREYWGDTIYFKGRFYAITCSDGSVSMYEFDASSISNGTTAPRRILPSLYVPRECAVYAVESSGELMVLVRIWAACICPCHKVKSTVTYKFHVFRVDWQQRKWMEVRSIGDHCIALVGHGQSTCLSSHDHPGWRGNSIYFTGHYTVGDGPGCPKNLDIGFFDLADHSSNRGALSVVSKGKPIFWFVPSK